MVGPFIFFDQFGPITMQAGQGQDVRPHPHIGLSTVTWLFDGKMYHRDSLGSEQQIAPGELNWMTAGKGIVHSERTPAESGRERIRCSAFKAGWRCPRPMRKRSPPLSMWQCRRCRCISDHGREVRVVAGSIYGATSPVKTHSDLFYADVKLQSGARLPLPVEHEERGDLYRGRVAGNRRTGSWRKPACWCSAPAMPSRFTAQGDARFMMLGGEPMDGPRHIWWNFVSSSKERIEAAKEDWKRARFDIVPGDEKEFIPLPAA